MDLGTRQIRTSGKGSGSVELTLPGELRRLVGLPCRILLHDGERPDIVLQPDLTRARQAFAQLWQALSQVLLGGPAPNSPELLSPDLEFPAAAFVFGLLPRHGAPDSPYLCWQDGLALAAGAAEPEAVARSIAACAQKMAGELGITPALAAPFASVCGFAAIGTVAFPEWQLHCDIASAALASHAAWRPGEMFVEAPDTRSPMFWVALKPPLCAVAELFAAWSLPGSAYPALRTAWRRGRSIEMNRG
jgi:hypothetical protein